MCASPYSSSCTCRLFACKQKTERGPGQANGNFERNRPLHVLSPMVFWEGSFPQTKDDQVVNDPMHSEPTSEGTRIDTRSLHPQIKRAVVQAVNSGLCGGRFHGSRRRTAECGRRLCPESNVICMLSIKMTSSFSTSIPQKTSIHRILTLV